MTTEPHAVRLVVRGQLDLMAVGAFGEALMSATRLRGLIELDLARVDFIDGSGLSMLINAMSRACRMGHRLIIVDASRYVCRLIEITDTADRLPPLLLNVESRDTQVGKQLAAKPFARTGAATFRV